MILKLLNYLINYYSSANTYNKWKEPKSSFHNKSFQRNILPETAFKYQILETSWTTSSLEWTRKIYLKDCRSWINSQTSISPCKSWQLPILKSSATPVQVQGTASMNWYILRRSLTSFTKIKTNSSIALVQSMLLIFLERAQHHTVSISWLLNY